MNKIKKLSFCFLSVVLILMSMCPISAYAADPIVIAMPSAQPVVDDKHCYFEVLYQHDNGNYIAHTYAVTYSIMATLDSNRYDTDYDYSEHITPALYVDLESNTFTFKLVRNSSSVSLLTYCCYYDVSSLGTVTYSPLSTLGASDKFFTGGGDSFKIVSVNAFGCPVVSSSSSTSSVTMPSFTCSYDSSQSVYNQLLEILSKLDTLIEDNDTFYEQLNELLTVEEDIYSKVNTIVNLLADEIAMTLYNIDWDLDDTNELLRQILDAINMKGESNLTSPDTSNIDDYYEIENGLINNTDVDVSNVVKVDINQNAMTFTWNLLDFFYSSNGKVFGLVLTVLSLGIIALILGR